MATTFKNGEEYYNRIYLLFNLFIAISLFPFGYLLLLRQSGQLGSMISSPWYEILIVSLLLSVGLIIYQANKTFTNFLKQVNKESNLRERLETYKAHSVKKYLSFLLAGLISVSGLYVTNNTLFVISYITAVILLSIKRPTLNTIIEDLLLDEVDQQTLIENKPIP